MYVTGEIRARHPGKKITIVQGADRLLSNNALPIIDKAMKKLDKRLAAMDITVHLNTRVTNLPAVVGGDAFLHEATPTMTRYTLDDGSYIEADMAIVCVGAARRTGNLVGAASLDEFNRVRVLPDLQVEGVPKVFCIGDANNVKETKLAYLAAKQAELAVKNVLKLASDKPTAEYTVMDGQKEYGIMFVPLGPLKGVGAMGSFVMGDYLVSTAKGKGLFSAKTFAGYNTVAPALV